MELIIEIVSNFKMVLFCALIMIFAIVILIVYSQFSLAEKIKDEIRNSYLKLQTWLNVTEEEKKRKVDDEMEKLQKIYEKYLMQMKSRKNLKKYIVILYIILFLTIVFPGKKAIKEIYQKEMIKNEQGLGK